MHLKLLTNKYTAKQSKELTPINELTCAYDLLFFAFSCPDLATCGSVR
jgi:hypothetical protein